MNRQEQGLPALLQRALLTHQQGDLQAAAKFYRQVLAIDALHPDALHLLGLVAYQTGDYPDAIHLIKRAIAVNPGVPGFHLNLGNALRRTGHLDEAIIAYQYAIGLKADYADAWGNLAVAFRENGDLALAEQALRNALRFKPDHADVLSNLGAVLKEQGKLEEAAEALKAALRSSPDHADALINLGAVLKEQGKLEEAAEALKAALRIKPESVETLVNLGAVKKDMGDIVGAVRLMQQAAALDPLRSTAHYNLANALMMAGQVESAIAAYRRALELHPHAVDAHSNLLFALNHSSTISAEDLLIEHLRFDEKHTRAITQAAPPHGVAARRPERLRVGYVSADLRRHPVGYFVSPLLVHHDKTRFEIWCFHNNTHSDDLTACLKLHSDRWVDCADFSDSELADFIRRSEVHILVDLSGHTAGNRLPMFAHKPAPVQITYLGYPNTTGLSAIDYRITDHIADPEEDGNKFNVETLWRLPGSYFCFRAPTESVEVAPPPVIRNGYVTFGYCGSFAKITPETLDIWVRLLKRVPHSRLLIRSKSLMDSGIARELLNFFAMNNIDATRIRTSGPLGHAEYLDGFREIDILLDGTPFNLATNTFEALWMGVPLVTLSGAKSQSRMGASILTALGLMEFVSRTSDEFLEKCVELSANKDKLAAIRQTLRGRLVNSGLMNGELVARKIEEAYDAMWAASMKGEGS